MSRATYGVNFYAIGNITIAGGISFNPSVKPNNEAFSIFWPRIRPGYAAKGIIFLAHGSGGGAKLSGSGGYYEALQNYLANVLGYVVLAGDFGSNGLVSGGATNPDTWANNVAMGALDAAYKWATQQLSGTSTGTAATTLTDTSQSWLTNEWLGHQVSSNGKTGIVTGNTATVLTVASWVGGTPSSGQAYTVGGHFSDVAPLGKNTKVILVGISMGGWVMRNWASRNTAKVACIVDICGVVDAAYVFGVAPNGTNMDYAYGAEQPSAAPGTPTGTAGAVAYKYKTCDTTPLGDGPCCPFSASANLAAQATLNTTPNTVPTITHRAYKACGQPVTGTKIIRSVSAGADQLIDTVGNTTLTVATGTGATTSLTIAPLPFAIPNGCVLRLSHPAADEGGTDAGVATTQDVTLTAAPAQGATTLTVTSFTPASGGATVAWAIGTKVKILNYIDRITGNGSAYTALSGIGNSATTGPYGVNGKGANPSYDPLDATNLTAGLKAINCQYWWTCNDNVTSAGSGTPGTVNTQVQTFATAYGANLTLKEIPGDPVHNGSVVNITADAPSLGSIASFITANAP